MKIQAIPTRYAGCHFRSRLEARWAVFFDALNIEWQYEPEGFKIGPNERPWLPDFLLPKSETWVEVKGSDKQLDRTLLCGIDYGQGPPGTEDSLGSTRGILVLGPIPRIENGWPVHAILQHHKYVYLSWVVFGADGALNVGSVRNDFGDGSAGVVYDGPICEPNLTAFGVTAPHVANAYAAARSARFEHGERKIW